MWVKICGLTREEDAAAAVEFGADAIGFVLTRSRRRADAAEVAKWVGGINNIEKVGVFIDEPATEIIEVAGALGLDSIQIHSSVRLDHFKLAERYGLIIAVSDLMTSYNYFQLSEPSYSFKSAYTPEAEHSRSDEKLYEITFRPRALSVPCRVLIDPSMGTGEKAQWKQHEFEFILAGGLTPDNVRQAITKARPTGVDVSSGIEKSPGIKDLIKMQKFISEAKR